MALIHCPDCNSEISDKAVTCPKCACPIPRALKCVSIISAQWEEYFKNITKGTVAQQVDFFQNRVIPDCQLQIPPSMQKSSFIWRKMFTGVSMDDLTTPEKMADFVVTIEQGIQKACSKLPRCPQCGSYLVREISGTRRVFGTALWGAASKNFGKSMECCDCSYRW